LTTNQSRPARAREPARLGLVLFYPAVADDELGHEILAGDPNSPRALLARKDELAAFLRGAFAP
jgi:hypothetical protein